MSLLDHRQATDTALGRARASSSWHPVCRIDQLAVGRGVAALVAEAPVAVFRLAVEGPVRVVDNVDPWTGASVLAHGLTGRTTVDGREVDYVASPLRKQRFDLSTGRCLDGDRFVRTWPVRVADGVVEVAVDPSWEGNDLETAP